VLASLNVGIGIVDKEETFTFVNPEAELIFETEPGTLIGRSLLEFLPYCQIEVVKNETRQRSNGQRTQYDLDIVTKGNAIKTIHVSGVPYYGPDGTFKGTAGSFIDVTRQRKYEREIQRRLDLESVASQISNDFVHLTKESLDVTLNHALEKIGRFVGVDRGYIFLFTEDGLHCNNTHEWCKEGISSQLNNMQMVSNTQLPWVLEKLQKFEPIYIPEAAGLPAEAGIEQQILKAQSIKSLLVIPLIGSEKLVGFLGFDSVSELKEWKNEDTSLLKLVGEIIGYGLERLKHEDELININTSLELKIQERNSDLIKLLELNRAIIDNVALIIISTDKHGIIKSFNPFAEKVLGYKAEEVIDKITPLDFHDRDEISQYLEKEIKDSNDLLIEFENPVDRYFGEKEWTLICKDGNKIRVLLTQNVLRNETGEIIGVVGVARDITKRKIAEKARIKTTQNLKCLIQNLHSGILFEDENGRINMVNQAFCNLFGIEIVPEALMGMECKDVYEACKHLFSDIDSFTLRIDEIITQCQPLISEDLYLNDGRVFGRDFIPILYEGDLLGYLWQFRDITERVQTVKYAIIQRDLGFNLAKTATTQQVLNEVLQAIIKFEGVNTAAIYLIDNKNQKLELYQHLNMPSTLIDKINSFDSESVPFNIIQSGESIFDFYDHESGISDILLCGYKHLGLIPIKHEGAVIGALSIGTKKNEGLNYTTKLLLEAICAQIGGTLDRINMGDALHLSQDNFQLMFETIDDFIFIINHEGQIIKTNPVVASKLGYTPEELQNKSILEIHPPDCLHKAKITLTKIIAGRLDICTLPLITKDGRLIPAETKIVSGKWDGKNVYYGIARDISERLKAEKTLRESEARWHFAIEGSGDGLWDWNMQTNEVYFSAQFKNILGFADSEFPNRIEEWEKRVHPEDMPSRNLNLQKHLDKEAVVYINEHRVLCKDGQYRWILSRGKVIEWTSDGDPVRIIGTCSDITTRKQLEEKLVKTIEKEKELSDLKSRFITTTSHEFRTPLASILMLSEMIISYQHKMDASQISNRLSKIKTHVLNLTNMVNDILHLSKINEGKINSSPQPEDVVLLCQNIVDSFNSSVITKGQINFNSNLKCLKANIDKHLITQSVNNLLSNAIKYNDDNPEISLTIQVDDSGWSVSVKDNGIGIPQADQKYLFKPFFRASNVSTIQGSGLGLNIVYESVKAHGGEVTCTSQQFVGTTFTLNFPKSLILENQEK
jgi:PAS domain S-box-containing protein